MDTGPVTGTPRQLPFTPEVKRSLVLAVEEANDLGHSHIRPEHLFAGLIRAQGVAARALQDLRIDVAELLAALRASGEE
ncbi:MAG: hypothetical protein GY711_17755 [bacterium]|nr:hypothetical protein [bacterium]